MARKRLLYMLLVVFVLAMISFFPEFPIKLYEKYIASDIQNSVVNYSETPYDFLYREEFEKALDKVDPIHKKNILLWHPEGDLSRTFTSDLGRPCGYCDVVNDLSLINDERTEAVVFLYRYTEPQFMPKKRNPKQYWIWRTGEPPPAMAKTDFLKRADDIGFNLTLSYRSDSDIRILYGYFDAMKFLNPAKTLPNKNSLAVIIISNCDYLPASRVRMQLIKSLISAGLQLTTSGSCFPESRQFSRSENDELFEFVSRHKFYLAFENSYHCKDYVSEKFFRAIEAGTVPVVWGSKKEDYIKHVPESGFIFVEDFPTLKDLIRHLNYLDKNDTAYLEYFKWRNMRLPNYRARHFICQICRFLHGINVDDAYKAPYHQISKDPNDYITEKVGTKIVESVEKWWLYGDNPECLSQSLHMTDSGKVIT